MSKKFALLVVIAMCIAAVPLAPVEPVSARSVPDARTTCSRPPLRDGADDADIDIAKVEFESSCRRATITLTTHRPFTDQELNRWGILFGPLAARPRESCDGFTTLVVVDGGPDGLEARGLPLRSCRSTGGSWRVATVERLSPRSIAVTIVAEDVLAGLEGRWQTFAYSWNDADANARPDVAPRLATFVRSTGVPVLEVEADHTADHRAVVVTYDYEYGNPRIDHYELRYRAGRTWTTIDDIDPRHRYRELAGLRPGREYTIQVRGMSDGRPGPWATTSIWYYVAPTAVRNVSVSFSDDRVVVAFDPPQSSTGDHNPQYQVVIVADDGSANGFATGYSSPISDPYLGLVPRPFTVWIRATNPLPGPWVTLHVDAPPPG